MLKGCCTGLSVSALVKIPHCWKSHVAAHMFNQLEFHRSPMRRYGLHVFSRAAQVIK